MISCVTKHIVRWGLISVVVVGATSLLIGPERVAAGFAQIRSMAGATIDDLVEDPVALRRQLEGLAEQYPQRIGEVRGELAEVEVQLRQIRHDSEVASRVIELAGDDLERIRERVVRANSEAPSGRKVMVGTVSGRVEVDQARSEGRRIAGIRAAYLDRVVGNRHQESLLERQRQRLQEILAGLESEYGEFESKLWQLDRQIDSIERNDRLIAMTREQQAMLADFEKLGKVGNLRQLEAKLGELRTTQEARLQALEGQGMRGEYEQRAREVILVDGDPEHGSLDPADLDWLR